MTTSHPFLKSGILWFISGLLYVSASVFLNDRTLYAFLGLSATLLLALSLRGVYRFMGQDAKERPLTVGIWAFVIGIPFLFAIYGLAYLEAVNAISPDTAEIANTIAILVGSTLTYGVGPALVSYSGLRHNLVPRWISWAGLIGGLFGLLWIGWVWLIPPSSILVFLPSVLLTYIWQLALGVVLMRFKETVHASIAGEPGV
ncbi:MAG: hypothetical protein R3293_12330 [Candidatus Promineifilaceae bacterium]|nr:hypothetical protein [Candidatus Promineifilaceae bacterium]